MPERQDYARCKEAHRIFREVLRSPRLGSRLLLGPGRVAELAEMVKEVAPRAEVHDEEERRVGLQRVVQRDDERVFLHLAHDTPLDLQMPHALLRRCHCLSRDHFHGENPLLAGAVAIIVLHCRKNLLVLTYVMLRKFVLDEKYCPKTAFAETLDDAEGRQRPDCAPVGQEATPVVKSHVPQHEGVLGGFAVAQERLEGLQVRRGAPLLLEQRRCVVVELREHLAALQQLIAQAGSRRLRRRRVVVARCRL